MSLIDFLLMIAIAVAFGSLAQWTSGYSRGGWIVNLSVGFLGALAGALVARSFDVPEIYQLTLGRATFPIIWSIIGSVLFLAAISLVVKPGQH